MSQGLPSLMSGSRPLLVPDIIIHVIGIMSFLLCDSPTLPFPVFLYIAFSLVHWLHFPLLQSLTCACFPLLCPSILSSFIFLSYSSSPYPSPLASLNIPLMSLRLKFWAGRMTRQSELFKQGWVDDEDYGGLRSTLHSWSATWGKKLLYIEQHKVKVLGWIEKTCILTFYVNTLQ